MQAGHAWYWLKQCQLLLLIDADAVYCGVFAGRQPGGRHQAGPGAPARQAPSAGLAHARAVRRAGHRPRHGLPSLPEGAPASGRRPRQGARQAGTRLGSPVRQTDTFYMLSWFPWLQNMCQGWHKVDHCTDSARCTGFIRMIKARMALADGHFDGACWVGMYAAAGERAG